jgi:hypothetical protein
MSSYFLKAKLYFFIRTVKTNISCLQRNLNSAAWFKAESIKQFFSLPPENSQFLPDLKRVELEQELHWSCFPGASSCSLHPQPCPEEEVEIRVSGWKKSEPHRNKANQPLPFVPEGQWRNYCGSEWINLFHSLRLCQVEGPQGNLWAKVQQMEIHLNHRFPLQPEQWRQFNLWQWFLLLGQEIFTLAIGFKIGFSKWASYSILNTWIGLGGTWWSLCWLGHGCCG